MTTQVFISHVTEDASVAAHLKRTVRKDFLGQVAVFLSTDTESIAAGELWLSSLSEALRTSNIVVVLCSLASLDRPWINFEAGAAWMRGIPVVPMCLGDLRPDDLTMPLSARQGMELGDAEGLRGLYAVIARKLGCELPTRSYEELADEFTGLAQERPADQEQPIVTATDKAIRSRLDEALSHPRYKWRTIDMVATVAAVPVDTVTEILREDDRVRFSRSRAGKPIVGLRTRVGRAN